MRTLGESEVSFFLFLVLIKGMGEEGESKISLCYSGGSGGPPRLFAKKVA